VSVGEFVNSGDAYILEGWVEKRKDGYSLSSSLSRNRSCWF